MSIRIGISGWLYPPWRGLFYPNGLPHKEELYFASRKLNSIEINGSFYSFQKPSSYQRWYNETPKDFAFSVKGSRFITHIRRLNDIEIPLANFFSSGVLYLQNKLGCFLWQFPASFRYESERLEPFFKLLPKTFGEAATFSEHSDRFSNPYPLTFRKIKTPLRHAIEVRHHSFENPEFIKLLRKYDIALVFADNSGRWPYMEDITTDFLYIRLHGDSELYARGYDKPTLRWWADRIKIWSAGDSPKNALTITNNFLLKKMNKRDIYVYFNNDVKAHAPFDAQTLAGFIKPGNFNFSQAPQLTH